MIDINLDNVSKSYGFDKILNNINLTINKGEKIALIGHNGTGKSTILKMIAGIESLSDGNISIRKGVTIGYLSQTPEQVNINVKDYIYESFKELLELQNVLEELENNLSSDIKTITKYTKIQQKFMDLGGYEFETKISKVLAAFNISNDMLQQNFNTLSGGEKTICSLIKLLLIEPDVLLLDEPTNHLDIEKIEWLEEYLSKTKSTVIVVSHDRYFLDKVVNKVVLITKRGLEEYFGNYTYFIKENEERLIQEFKNYKDQEKIITAMKNSIKKLQEFGKLCGDSGGEIFFRRAESIRKRLEKLEKIEKPESKKNLNLNFSSDIKSSREVLKVTNLNLKFDEKILFDEVCFNLYYKDKACIIGKNGTGKSTLIKEILKNKDYVGNNIQIGYIPQEIIFDDPDISVLEEARKYFIGLEEHLRAALYKFLFVGENVYKKIKYLSRGEKVRLKLFCLIQEKYNFLILDEPTNHIDIDTREVLENALVEFNGTILFVSHDRYFINKIATHIIEINNKRINKHIGNYDDYTKTNGDIITESNHY